MEDNTTTVRDALESTVPEADDEIQSPSMEAEESAPVESQQSLDLGDAESGSSRDERGRFKAKQQKPEESLTPAIQPGPKSEPRQSAAERAPASWRPEIREHWATLPNEVRAEISRRELDVQRAMQESAQTRQMVEQFNQVIAPYEMFIRAEGSNPLAAVDNLMATAARLRTATAPELAGLVAGIVNQFGVGRFGNSFIEQLDGALAGNIPKADPMAAQQQQLQAALAQQLAPVQNFMQQLSYAQQAQQQQVYQQATGEVQDFLSQTEFGDDVRADMADIIEMGARRGKNIGLREAYQQACVSNPQIMSILQKRAASGSGRQSAAQRARAAAVSVSGAPAPSGPSEEANDVRSAIEAAIAVNSR